MKPCLLFPRSLLCLCTHAVKFCVPVPWLAWRAPGRQPGQVTGGVPRGVPGGSCVAAAAAGLGQLRAAGGAAGIGLLIASLRGLRLAACYSLLLCCGRQSGICVPIACCKMHEILLILLGNENRKMRASRIGN